MKYKKAIYTLVTIGFGISLTLLILFGRVIYWDFVNKAPYLFNNSASNNALLNFYYTSALDLNITGTLADDAFYRLPAKYKTLVRPEVWKLSQNTSGIALSFTTNSPSISVKWKLKEHRSHKGLNSIASSGVDLYGFINKQWQYLESGVPHFRNNEQLLVSDMDTSYQSYMLYLPLYDGIKDIEIGVKKGFKVLKEEPLYSADKPIVFYGTSITQGASASRPGLAYPSIVSRNLNIETINLGFSSNGKFESSVGAALCEIDASVFVIDCVPNSNASLIKKKVLPLIRQIKACRPKAAIILVEKIDRVYTKKNDPGFLGGSDEVKLQNLELQKAFTQAKKLGFNDLYYLSSDSIGFKSGETVDGIHLNDLGMQRLANSLSDKIREVLLQQ